MAQMSTDRRRNRMSETHVVIEGLGFPESTRWRDGRVWLCNWGAGEVLAVTPDGRVRVEARVAPQTLPFSIDWLPDGRRWPNGMALVDDGRTLVVADSHALELVGFDVADDGTLSGRRVWAPVEQ